LGEGVEGASQPILTATGVAVKHEVPFLFSKWKPLPHSVPVHAGIIRANVSFEGAAPEEAA